MNALIYALMVYVDSKHVSQFRSSSIVFRAVKDQTAVVGRFSH